MEKKMKNVESTDLCGIYKEVAEQVGVQEAYVLYQYFRGQQVSFPLRFYSGDFIGKLVREEYDGKNIRDMARKYGYSERKIRLMLKD